MMSNPKLFVSYSWTNPDHENWVLKLATQLRECGVDVILDKWDLKEGHDAHAFMERMVTDPEVRKVILICDKAYAEKANQRTGGVGTETQIISPEIYAKAEQDKFVAIVRESDEDGNPYLPTYYKSRIYIDLSDPSTYSENFERLLRWIYDEPLYKKPELGKKPDFLTTNPNTPHLATSYRFKRAIDAVRDNRQYADAAISEYLEVFAKELEKLRIEKSNEEPEEPFDEKVVRSIESFIPYRNEIIELFLTIAIYRDTEEAHTRLHRFFEQLIPYLGPPGHMAFDNFKFIIHELFLYAIASLLRYERFEAAVFLMQNQFYIPENSDYGRDVLVPFRIFRAHLESLKRRNQRLKLNRLSLHADFLKERCKGIAVEFRHLMQADFILFLRDNLDHPETGFHWWPETLVYSDGYSGPFEIFARSCSHKYFERSKILLGIESKEELLPLFDAFRKGQHRLPRWEHVSIDPIGLVGYEQLATLP